MSVTKRFGAWCGQEVSELIRLSVETVRECAGQYGRGCRRFALQREGKGVVSISCMVVERSGRHYLPFFSTEGAAL